MAAQAGERRLRALCPEPGHRQWVVPPSSELVCSLCDEPYMRVAAREVCARSASSVTRSSEPPASLSRSRAATPSAGAAQ